MQLLGNTVLLEPLPKPAQSPGGVFYDLSRRDDRMQYYVRAVGPGRKLKDGTVLVPEVRVGDKCLCNPDRLGTRYAFEDGRIIVDADNIEMIWT